MKRNLLKPLALFGAATFLFAAGCGPSGETAKNDAPATTTTGGTGGTGGGKTFKIGMSQCNLGEPYRVQMDNDIREAAKAHPELNIVFKDAQNDSLKQRTHVEEFVADKVDLLIISPLESQPLTDPVAKAIDAGIPVIVVDRSVLGDKYTTFIGADNKKIGLAAGKWLVEKLGGKGKIVELKGLMTTAPAQDRHAGFMEGIAGSGIEIVFDADTKWLEPNARKEMESALARIPKIDAVYAHNDPGAHGAFLAAQASGRDKEMIFFGIDALPQEGRAYVGQGYLAASFQYPTGGKEAVETALKILNKEEVPKKIVLESLFFTKENMPNGEPVK